MLRIKVNNRGMVQFTTWAEQEAICVVHYDGDHNIKKWYKLPFGDIITLLNIYNHMLDKGYKLDDLTDELFDTIDKFETKGGE